MRTMRELFEVVSKKVGPDQYKFKGKKGHWRTVKGSELFFPDDGSSPLGMPKAMKSAGKKSVKPVAGGGAGGGGGGGRLSASDVGLPEKHAQDFDDAVQDSIDYADEEQKANDWGINASDKIDFAMDNMRSYLGQSGADEKMTDDGWKKIEKMFKSIFLSSR